MIPVHSAGFVGSKNLGNKLAGEALLDHVVGTLEPDDVGPYDINILGEFNLAGEFWLVKPLLDELGIRIRACIPGDARYADVASAHTAKATMMVCSTALINLARKMEERWGIPFFEGSFLRHRRHLRRAAPNRDAAGPSGRRCRADRSHRGGDRAGRGRSPGPGSRPSGRGSRAARSCSTPVA